uniref:Uncharacterized protein n=1 Tax=Arundo donax TaxID=35708 RepID=A0A0A9HIZ1_ARUDO
MGASNDFIVVSNPSFLYDKCLVCCIYCFENL